MVNTSNLSMLVDTKTQNIGPKKVRKRLLSVLYSLVFLFLGLFSFSLVCLFIVFFHVCMQWLGFVSSVLYLYLLVLHPFDSFLGLGGN